MLQPWLIRGFGIALVITIVLAGFGNAVLYLWNDVVPAVFGLRAMGEIIGGLASADKEAARDALSNPDVNSL